MSFFSRPLMESKDAAELNLGDEFSDDACLSNAEVAVILEKQKANYEEQRKLFTSVFKKTHAYVMRFTGTKDPVANQASIMELREALMEVAFQHEENGQSVEHRLEEFEIACLSNLNPEEVEEAVALIPCLSKHLTDVEIEEVMAIISRTTARMFRID
ncbi:RNA polymerase B [Phytophthora boehmeriae]|uniref:RNA polymerase B n=1 Tax=Phytophthora boehmeriae TaxID=109152 RepID=A0A8T1X830_9STRA|nr:RNA polymerase B [Phytophthora boehmeriae]